MSSEKTCTKCGETKPPAEFSKEGRGQDGLKSSCKACVKVYRIERYKANTEKEKAVSAQRYAESPEKCKAASAKWNANHPEACRIIKQNRRARERTNGGRLSPGLAAKLFKLQRGKCACCRVSIADGNHLDHVIPVASGGPNEDWNMQLLCGPCNMSKGAKHPVEFMQQRGFLL